MNPISNASPSDLLYMFVALPCDFVHLFSDPVTACLARMEVDATRMLEIESVAMA